MRAQFRALLTRSFALVYYMPPKQQEKISSGYQQFIVDTREEKPLREFKVII
jgi:hypothetical protein